MNLEQLDRIIVAWKGSLCPDVELARLFSRNPTAHKWKTTYRILVLRELTFWRTVDLLETVSTLMRQKHYLGSRM